MMFKLSTTIVVIELIISCCHVESSLLIVKQDSDVTFQLEVSHQSVVGMSLRMFPKFDSMMIVIWKYGITLYNQRIKFKATNKGLTVTITGVKFEDAGNYTIVGFTTIDYHEIVVIGEVVFRQENGKHQQFISGKDTIESTCSFNISAHPWGVDYPRMEVEGALNSKVINKINNSYEVNQTFFLGGHQSRHYKCTVTLGDNSTLQSSHVAVIVKDTSKDGNETYMVAKGHTSLIFSCTTNYDNNEQWKWFKDYLFRDLSFPIVDCFVNSTTDCVNQSGSIYFQDYSSQFYSFLSFEDLELNSTGSYTCIDDMFTVQKTFNLIVVEGMPNMEINGNSAPHNKTFEIIKGINIITCSMTVSDGTHPKLIVTDAVYMKHTYTGDQLVYVYKTATNKSMIYTCYIDIPEGYKVLGEIKNWTVNVEVFYCPESLEIISDTKMGSIEQGSIISCRTSSNPDTILKWTSDKDDKDQKLSIDEGPNYANLRVYKNGTYFCSTVPTFHRVLGVCETITSSFGTQNVVPRSHQKIQKIVLPGTNLTLQCNTLHYKNNNWKWVKNWNALSEKVKQPMVNCRLDHKNVKKCSNISNTERFQDFSSSLETKLYFPRVESEDSGNYTCFDSLRTVVKTFQVMALGCPSQLMLLKEKQPSGLQLTCSVSSNFPVNVSLTAENQDSILATGLNMVTFKPTHNGLYWCMMAQVSHPLLGKCGKLSSVEFVEEESLSTR